MKEKQMIKDSMMDSDDSDEWWWIMRDDWKANDWREESWEPRHTLLSITSVTSKIFTICSVISLEVWTAHHYFAN